MSGGQSRARSHPILAPVLEVVGPVELLGLENRLGAAVSGTQLNSIECGMLLARFQAPIAQPTSGYLPCLLVIVLTSIDPSYYTGACLRDLRDREIGGAMA